MVILAIYGRNIAFDFVRYDDQIYVSENPYVLFPSGERLARLWAAPREGIYIPLAYTSYVAIGQFATYETEAGFTKVDASAFHVASITVHFACSLMVWMIMLHLVRNAYAALVAALLFACHPLQVESVAWVSGFSCQLGALFSLIAIYLFLKYVQAFDGGGEPQPQRVRLAWPYYWVATLAFAAALLSKPQEVTVPLMAALVAGAWHGGQWKRIAVSLSLWLLLALVLALITLGQQTAASMEYTAPLWIRPFILGESLSYYISKLMWPLNLTPDTGHLPRELMKGTWFYFSWIVPVAVLAAMAVLRVGRVAWVAAGIFVLALLPVLGLIPFSHQDISTVADRYAYLAMLGPALAVAGWQSVWPGLAHRAIAGTVLVFFAVTSFVQAGHWRDTKTLVGHALQVNDRSWIMRNVKSHYLEREGNEQQAGRELEIAVEKLPDSASANYSLAVWRLNHAEYELAMKHVRAALELNPKHPRAMVALGKLYWEQGDFQRSYEAFQSAIAIAPNDSVSRLAFAQLLLAAGRVDDAIAQYETVIDRYPFHADAIATLGELLLQQGDLARAETLCRRAVVLAPEWHFAHANLGLVLLNQGNLDEAIREFQIALRLRTDAEEVRINLGVALINAGRLDEAEAQLRRVVESLPESAAAHYNLAALLVRMNRLEEARTLLQQALALDPNHQEARIQLQALGDAPQ